jgi:hypothetical protein
MRRHYNGVTAFVGLPGSGKTYSLAKVGLDAMARGRTVWANVDHTMEQPWLAGARPFASFDEFAQIPNDAVIVWDELPLFVNARKWQDFPDGLLYRLTQIRKDGLELYFSTIDWRMVDVNVRRITFWTWECEHVIGRLHRRVLWPPEERRKKDDRPRRRELMLIRSSIGDAYDTLGKVSAPLMLPTTSVRPAAESAGVLEDGGDPAERGAVSSWSTAGRRQPRRARS